MYDLTIPSQMPFISMLRVVGRALIFHKHARINGSRPKCRNHGSNWLHIAYSHRPAERAKRAQTVPTCRLAERVECLSVSLGTLIILIRALFPETFLKTTSFISSTLSCTLTSRVLPEAFFATNLFRTSFVVRLVWSTRKRSKYFFQPPPLSLDGAQSPHTGNIKQNSLNSVI